MFTKFLSGNGNFWLVREMNGKKDEDDVLLTGGNAYFVEWTRFDEYLKIAGKTQEEVRF